jgi:signal transduction histidine kinase
VVEDNGIGIEARDVERIFGMFQRLHTEREYPGLGVGLALCRRIIRAHGGELSVDSRPGRGSKFIMTFPASAWPTLRPANDGPHGGKAE